VGLIVILDQLDAERIVFGPGESGVMLLGRSVSARPATTGDNEEEQEDQDCDGPCDDDRVHGRADLRHRFPLVG